MTSARLRRSVRNTSKSDLYKESSDSESGSEEEQSDYEAPTSARPRPVKRTKKTKSGPQAKRAKVTRKKTVNIDKLEAELPENYLYQALAQPDIDIQDLALEWIESFVEDEEEGQNASITILINLLLRSCGSVYLFEAHDLVNLESAAETVGELTILFGNQKTHKYPFKALPLFRNNTITFFEELMKIAHEKGTLYKYGQEHQETNDETYLASPLMNQILTWISSLSSCTIRPLRYIATSILLSIQNELCTIINTVVVNLEKSQRQLTRTNQKNKSRVQTLSRTVQSYQNQKDTILEYFNEICDVTLGHRYRDIDPVIRQECIKYLGQAMYIFPDHFFQPSFLRYFGWLLSDPSNHVRVEVTRVLVKLYKNCSSSGKSNSQILSIGFRQFTERYKEQIIKMNTLDSDVNVRLNTISICCELVKIGFLNESDCNEIISIFYQITGGEDDSFKSISKTNHTKLRTEVGKFINTLSSLRTSEYMEKFSRFVNTYKSTSFPEDGPLLVQDCIKFKVLIDLLKKSVNQYKVKLPPESQKSFMVKKQISESYEILYALPSFENSWEKLIRYVSLDVQQVEFSCADDDLNEENVEIEEFKSVIDPSDEIDKDYLLYFIDGAIHSIVSKKGNEISGIMTQLANYLPSLQSLAKSNTRLSAFLSIWLSLIRSSDPTLNIFAIFNETGKSEVYNNLTVSLLKDYQNYVFQDEVLENEIMEAFEHVFERLLEGYNNIVTEGLNILTPKIRLQTQTLVAELLSQLNDSLHPSDTTDITSESAVDDSEDALRYQKRIVQIVTDATGPVIKLQKIGDLLDLNEFVKPKRAVEGTDVFAELARVFKGFKVRVFLKSYSNNFLQLSPKLLIGFKSVLDLFLIVASWNIEKVLSLNEESKQQEFDVEELFGGLNTLISTLVNILSDLSESISIVFEDDLKSRYSLIKTINEFKTMFTAKIIDFITSIKMFYVKFKSSNSFRNFDKFFGDKQTFGSQYVVRPLPDVLQDQFLDLFLYKEAQLAKEVGVQLDRTDEENVNIEDLVQQEEGTPELEEEVTSRSMFDSDDESEEETAERQAIKKQKALADESKQSYARQKRIWLFEKDLCVYALKIFALIDMSIIADSVNERVGLNAEKLGGVFAKLVKQHNRQTGDTGATSVPAITKTVAASSNPLVGEKESRDELEEVSEQVQDVTTELDDDRASGRESVQN